MLAHAGVARHAYNWGLATCILTYESTNGTYTT
ncbi:MAG: helix-turn-helix domain-containing protein [Okeania sp. SIO2F4]|nr:helix-turn-helix domain-containing protein [Okeania sp. SIO2F4]